LIIAPPSGENNGKINPVKNPNPRRGKGLPHRGFSHIQPIQKRKENTMPNKTMLIIFPDGDEAANLEKTMLISAYLAGEADIVLREPEEDKPVGIAGMNPACIRHCFDAFEDEIPLPY
jgi:hypothetical protein